MILHVGKSVLWLKRYCTYKNGGFKMATKRKRRARYIPDFEKTCLPWVRSFIRTHFWEVASYYEYDDLMQDAYIFFLRTKLYYVDHWRKDPRVRKMRKFTRKIDNPAWFFRVFRYNFERYFTRLKLRHEKLCQEIVVARQRTSDGYNIVDVLDHLGGPAVQEMAVLVKECAGSASHLLREVTGTNRVTRRILGPVRTGAMVRV